MSDFMRGQKVITVFGEGVVVNLPVSNRIAVLYEDTSTLADPYHFDDTTVIGSFGRIPSRTQPIVKSSNLAIADHSLSAGYNHSYYYNMEQKELKA